jgi:hypothetical protein
MKVNGIEVRSCYIHFEPTKTIYVERCDYTANHIAYMEREIKKGNPAYAYFKWQVEEIIKTLSFMELIVVEYEEDGYWMVIKS